MKGLIAAILLGLMCCVHTADDEATARLLVSKTIQNQLLVEGKDLTVEYNIFNVGSTAAMEVELTDNTFPESDFKVIIGLLEAKWERIGPSSNVSHSVVLKPLSSGYFNFTSAEVSYLSSEEAVVPTISYTTAPGEGGIHSFRDFDRKFSPHILDWIAFAVMTLPSLGIPFLLWYSSKSKYNATKPKKN